MKKLIFILFILISINNNLVFSQSICPDPSQWTSENEFYGVPDFNFNISATVDYKKGIVNDPSGSHIGVIIDWSTLDYNCPILREKTIRHLVELDIVSKLVPYGIEKTVYVYYESECKATVSLWLNLSQSPALDCCDSEYSNPESAVNKTLNGQTYRTKQITKVVNCGIKCCARVYTGHWNQNSLDYSYDFILTSRNTVSVTDCNCTTTYYDCDGNPLPCTSNCFDPNFDE